MTHGRWALGFFCLRDLSAESAPSADLAGSLSLSRNASSSSGLGSRRTRQRLWLSGDQAKSWASCGVLVRRCASPPLRLSCQIWVLPSSRAERKARYFPSGLQRGWVEETPSAVSGTASPPANGTIQ